MKLSKKVASKEQLDKEIFGELIKLFPGINLITEYTEGNLDSVRVQLQTGQATSMHSGLEVFACNLYHRGWKSEITVQSMYFAGVLTAKAHKAQLGVAIEILEELKVIISSE